MCLSEEEIKKVLSKPAKPIENFGKERIKRTKKERYEKKKRIQKRRWNEQYDSFILLREWQKHGYNVGSNAPPQINDKRRYYREEYLKSDHWKELRKRKLKQSPICEKCGSNGYVEPHHLQYKNLYDVKLKDLMTLCRKCHVEEHKNLKLIVLVSVER
jgi:predicted nucleic-acid-binding Zn-ribbon protein